MATLMETTREFQVLPYPSVSGYEVFEEIGRGGMGVVYKARHIKLGRQVALKVLLPELVQSSEKVARFQIEANAVARLQHPNIVQIFEVGDFDGRPFIALELVEGGNLADKLGTPWPAGSAAELVEKLARAMHYAHERGIVHRDLKPANILLVSGGVVSGEWSRGRSTKDYHDLSSTTHHSPLTAYQPKITDFGLAKLLDEDPATTPRTWRTQLGVVLGSPPYMAPEQAAGRTQEVGPATDIHALGMILYEMLTTRPPFRGASLLETLEQVKSQIPLTPSKLVSGLSPELDAICLKCLEKNPRRRYATAEALAEDLSEFRQSLARQSQQARIPVTSRARRSTILALQTILAIISALGSGLTVWQVFRAEKETRLENFKSEEAEEGIWDKQLGPGSLDDLKNPSSRQSALLALNLGLACCDRGGVAQGLLWFARGLKEAPVEDQELQRLIRANLAKWRVNLTTLHFEFPHSGQVENVGFRVDGKIVFTLSHVRSSAADQHTEVCFWDLTTGQQIYQPIVRRELVTNTSMTPDGTAIILAGPGSAAWLLDVQTGQLIGQPLCHNGEVTCVAVSNNSRFVLTGSADHTAQIWNARTGQPIGPPLQHQGAVTTVAFSPDSAVAATGSEDRTVLLWDTATGASKGLLMKHEGAVRALAYSPKGHMLLTGGDDRSARLWDTTSGKPIGQPFVHADRVLAIALSPDGMRFATGSADRTARIWQTARAKEPLILSHPSVVKSVQFSPDGSKLLTTSLDFTAQIWDSGTGKRVWGILSRPDKVTTALFSPEGLRMLTGNQNGSAKLWEIGTNDTHGSAGQCKAPDLLTGEVEKIVSWVERVTGSKIDSILESEQQFVVHSQNN